MWFERGDSVHEVCEREYNHTLRIFRSISRHGYKISKNMTVPVAKVLINSRGELRFVQADGAHRLGILSALGYDRVTVQMDFDHFPIVNEENIRDWTYVKSGLVKQEEAKRLFDLYFSQDGSERAGHLGVI
jgi:hypothetical protein